MIKVIGIGSSPHRSGSSVSLLREALEGAAQAGAETQEIYVPDYRIEFCRGCLGCLSGERCTIDDDLRDILDAMLAADGMILSSPTYGLAMNARMKNLFDRIGMWSVYRSALSGKYVVGISTAGAAGAPKTAQALTGVADGLFGRSYVSGTLGVAIGAGDADAYRARARQLGQRIVDDIRRQRTYPLQKLPDRLISALFLERLMKRNVLANKDGSMRGVYAYLHARGQI
jgi:multimeric flavodoxin WrbA